MSLLSRVRGWLRHSDAGDGGAFEVIASDALPVYTGQELQGHQGEIAVQKLLDRDLGLGFHRLDNLTLTHGKGTAQVDHVVLGPTGIFVIETKNLSGWIFAEAYDKVWAQQVRKGRTFTFQNPIRQNYSHTCVIEEIVGSPASSHVKGVVVFLEQCEFKKGRIPGVVFLNELTSHLKSFTETVLTPEQVDLAVAALANRALRPNAATHRRHAAHVSQRTGRRAQLQR